MAPLVGLFVLDIVPVGQEIVGVALLACLPVETRVEARLRPCAA